MPHSWYDCSVEELIQELGVPEKGLSQAEVTQRQQKYGLNEIKTLGGTKWYHILLAQFTNIMVLILIAASVVSALLHEYIDAAAIGVIIVINAVVGFIQEYRAEKAVEALKEMAAPHALVMRDGQLQRIEARQLVPGDRIILEEGAQIPADARITQSAQLHCVEASLTGESTAVGKSTDPVTQHSSLGDLHNMVFMGTVISQGHGEAIVVETGMHTEFGKIAHMVQTEEDGPTPLQKQLDKLSKILALFVGLIIALLFGLSFFTGQDLVEMFLLSISLAVSVIPEGLPAVITLTLAIGVQKIAKHNAIMRKLPAAETLGSTSVICTDKTGTLTQNQMTVSQLYLNGQDIAVSGVGYAPEGKIEGKSKELEWLLHIGALCNNAKLIQKDAEWTAAGDPTEGCLLTLTRKAGLDPQELNQKLPRSDELVFDSDRKRMSTHNGNFMYTKGAPNAVLDVCTHIQENGQVVALTPEKKQTILEKNKALAREAYRVLGFAYKELKGGQTMTEDQLIFVGLAGMMDPPRPEVKDAIAKCHDAHIHVVMITGDHALTAEAIGEQIGLIRDGDTIVTGTELEAMSEADLNQKVDKVRIFARVSPHHKVKILKALQGKGHIVAMTGDGVNDAPALQSADIGIAMGITGTDVAKEASEMILTDDNFATIVNTVERGRVIYRNIKKFIRFLLSANFDEILLISIVFLLGYPIPFLPLQILWVNLLTDALPAIALGTDVPDADIMKLKPRDPKASIWRSLLKFSLMAGVLSAIVSLILYFQTIKNGSIEHTRTMMFTVIVIFELLLVFSVRSSTQHYFTNFFKNKLLLFSVVFSLGLQLLAIYAPPFQTLLETEPLTLTDWAWIVSLCAGAVFILEIWKRFHKAETHV